MAPQEQKLVFFTCSTTHMGTHKEVHKQTILALRRRDVKVISNINLDEFFADSGIDDFSGYSNSATYFSTMKKVSQADMLVVDCTVPSMTIGHIVTYALSNKKPVLLLTEYKENDTQDLFINGSEEPLLTFGIYKTHTDIDTFIRKFMRKTDNDSKVRLNFVVDKDLSDKLDWLSFRTKMTKTDIIRKAITSFNSDL